MKVKRYSKESCQPSEEASHRMGENLYICRVVVSKIHKELKLLTSRKQYSLKMDHETGSSQKEKFK